MINSPFPLFFTISLILETPSIAVIKGVLGLVNIYLSVLCDNIVEFIPKSNFKFTFVEGFIFDI